MRERAVAFGSIGIGQPAAMHTPANAANKNSATIAAAVTIATRSDQNRRATLRSGLSDRAGDAAALVIRALAVAVIRRKACRARAGMSRSTWG